MTEALLSRQTAMQMLEPHLVAMRECVERGWEQWRESVDATPRFAVGRKTTRANVVYDFVSAQLEAYFDSVGICTSRKRGFLTVSVGNGVLELRFKKFDHPQRLTTSGVPTAQRLAIENQQVPFDGMEVTYVTVGYYPDELGMGLEVIALACSYGRELKWSINLLEEVASSAPVMPLIGALELDDGPTVRSTRKVLEDRETEAS